MTKLEYNRCLNSLKEAAYSLNVADSEYKRYEETNDVTWLMSSFEHRGYAEGIVQALACIGFRHKDLEKLSRIL